MSSQMLLKCESLSVAGYSDITVKVTDEDGLTDEDTFTATIVSAAVACTSNANCGTDGLVGNNFCSGGNVHKTFRTFTCSNPGISSASCSSTGVGQLQETCTVGCLDGACTLPSCSLSSASWSTNSATEGDVVEVNRNWR